MSLPNWISVGRIVLIPAFMVALLAGDVPGDDTLAALLFVIAAMSDSLDGYLARSRSSITVFGTFLDPLADKLLITSALVSLVQLDRIEAWAAMVIIGREFAVTGLRMVAAGQDLVIPASSWGKAKTFTQNAAVLAIILAPGQEELTAVLLGIALAATVASGLDYFVKARGVLRAAT